MRKYILRRLFLTIPTIFLVTIIVFLSIRLIPGDVIDFMQSRQMGKSVDRESLERILGLDQPIYFQYGRWMGDILLRGSLGESLVGYSPVTKQIFPRLPITIELGFLALVVSLIIALPIGIYSAIRQDSVGDYIGRSAAISFISVPGFWIATIVVLYPSLLWGWVPELKHIPITEDLWGNLLQFIVPATVLGMLTSGIVMRMTRSMMLEVLRQDYIRTAYSKGLTERVVVVRHALKNSFIPVITIIGLQMPILVAGSVIIERIFALPGIGVLLLDALKARDYPVVSGVNLVVATGVIGINLVVDLAYAWLDPRVQYR